MQLYTIILSLDQQGVSALRELAYHLVWWSIPTERILPWFFGSQSSGFSDPQGSFRCWLFDALGCCLKAYQKPDTSNPCPRFYELYHEEKELVTASPMREQKARNHQGLLLSQLNDPEEKMKEYKVVPPQL